MQESGLTEITPFICISAIWSQRPVIWFFTSLLSSSLTERVAQLQSCRLCFFLGTLWTQQHVWRAESLMAMTSLFIHMSGNTAFHAGVCSISGCCFFLPETGIKCLCRVSRLSSLISLCGSDDFWVVRSPTLASTQFQRKHTAVSRAQGGCPGCPSSVP